jgi:hypothetical protein
MESKLKKRYCFCYKHKCLNLIFILFAKIKIKKPETDLEKEIAKLLQSSENYIKDQKLLTQAEIKGLETMNLQEVGGWAGMRSMSALK